MKRTTKLGWAVLAIALVATPAVAQEIKEGHIKKGQPLAHAPGSWLSMTGASYVSGAFKWDEASKRYVVRDDVTLEGLPSAVKMDLAMARERRKAEGRDRQFGSLKEEVEASLSSSKYLLNNQYISSERRELYKKVHDSDDFGWWGHCNGEAAASLYEKVPTKDVEIHGIKFSPNDFKELYTLGYSGDSPTEFRGSRSNISNSVYTKAKELLKNPEDPKFVEEARKLYKEAFYVDAPASWEAKHFKSLFDKQTKAFDDMTPMDFHDMLTRSVEAGNGLVFDRSPGNVVWNYPASGYESEIKKSGTKEIDGKTLDVYDLNTKVVYGDYSDYTWSGGGGYEYQLYVDPATGKAVGGEWTGSSVTDHPDFAWKPTKSLKDLENDPTRTAEKRKMVRDSKAIERYLAEELKKKGYSEDVIKRLKEGDYIAVLAETKGKDDELGRYVNYLSDLQNELTYRSIYTGARTLHDKYAAEPANVPAPGPSVSDRLNEAGNSGATPTGGANGSTTGGTTGNTGGTVR